MSRASISYIYSEYSMQSALVILAARKMHVRYELKTYLPNRTHCLFLPLF